MGKSEIVKFVVPILLIIFGVYLKINNNDNYLSCKKYWLYFLLGGIVLFLIRLYMALKR